MTYKDAGVDVKAKASLLKGISEEVRSTFTDRVLNQPGSFAGLFRASFPTMKEPVLVATNDGVGTKTRVARLVGRHRGIGADIVNHCINDALVQGAEPLFFLDYFASAKLDRAVFEEVVGGAAEACRAYGIALLGGETAETDVSYSDVVVANMPPISMSSLTQSLVPKSGMAAQANVAMRAALNSRSKEAKRDLLSKYGGSLDTEKAVSMPLTKSCQLTVPSTGFFRRTTGATSAGIGGKVLPGSGRQRPS